MMAEPLTKRLATLAGPDAAANTRRLHATSEKLVASPAFAATLARMKALSDERRLLALALLQKQGELCACEIQSALGLTHATVSHHMTTLVKAELVTAERRGKWVYYRPTDDAPPIP